MTIYSERLTSTRTEAIFLALALVSFLLVIWRINDGVWDALAVFSFCFFLLFCFYSLNYHTLTIRISPEALKLKFGVFTWTVPVENIQDACLDDDPPLITKYGGAGIHFMTVRKRYRASFNFLEYSRVAVIFKRKVGPVREISFSTRRPDEVIRSIRQAQALR